MYFGLEKVTSNGRGGSCSLFKSLRLVLQVLAGPSVGQFLAELGADVVKVGRKRARAWLLAYSDVRLKTASPAPSTGQL